MLYSTHYQNGAKGGEVATEAGSDEDYGEVFLDIMKVVYEVLLRLAPPDSAITIALRASIPESEDAYECLMSDDPEPERVCRLLRHPEMDQAGSETAVGIAQRIGRTVH